MLQDGMDDEIGVESAMPHISKQDTTSQSGEKTTTTAQKRGERI
jgi:hypothetical protein